ncbi:MAG TPA: hypothetical protein VLE53_01085 [Gemmatimonadaceae bacterium]|nr:hypothetical protein [Gemmatimonadaceae bacterium]
MLVGASQRFTLLAGASGLVSGFILLGFAEVLTRLRELLTGECDPVGPEAPPRRHFGASQGRMFRRLNG